MLNKFDFLLVSFQITFAESQTYLVFTATYASSFVQLLYVVFFCELVRQIIKLVNACILIIKLVNACILTEVKIEMLKNDFIFLVKFRNFVM